MSTQTEVDVYQCDNCGHTVYKEEETICWECGKGEMCYVGKAWIDAEPLPCPSRWEVIMENIELWWKRNAGDPDDPNGFGVNLLSLIMWSIVIGMLLVGAVFFS